MHSLNAPSFVLPPSLPKKMWCASQPGIIAQILGLKPSLDASAFLEDQKHAGQDEYWWPTDTSFYDEIKLLFPNYYLDVTTAKAYRFWPQSDLVEVSLQQVVETSANMLRGLMTAAAKRFSLRILITAGWDSRVVLASTRDIESNIAYVTFLKDDLAAE